MGSEGAEAAAGASVLLSTVVGAATGSTVKVAPPARCRSAAPTACGSAGSEAAVRGRCAAAPSLASNLAPPGCDSPSGRQPSADGLAALCLLSGCSLLPDRRRPVGDREPARFAFRNDACSPGEAGACSTSAVRSLEPRGPGCHTGCRHSEPGAALEPLKPLDSRVRRGSTKVGSSGRIGEAGDACAFSAARAATQGNAPPDLLRPASH